MLVCFLKFNVQSEIFVLVSLLESLIRRFFIDRFVALKDKLGDKKCQKGEVTVVCTACRDDLNATTRARRLQPTTVTARFPNSRRMGWKIFIQQSNALVKTMILFNWLQTVMYGHVYVPTTKDQTLKSSDKYCSVNEIYSTPKIITCNYILHSKMFNVPIKNFQLRNEWLLKECHQRRRIKTWATHKAISLQREFLKFPRV